jgi:hypothetical protein
MERRWCGARRSKRSARAGCEDWDFWLRLVERGFRGSIVPEVLFYYRRRADSMSRMMLDEQKYRHPLDVLVRKHAAAYREHLIPVLVAKETEVLHLSREIADLQRDALVDLDPALRRAREELEAISRKAARVRAARAVEEERERLAWKAAELEREVRDLRASWSWRITAPLRKIYARITGVDG